MDENKLINLVEELSNTFGPSGFEDEVLDVISKHVEKLSLERDSINNLYVRLNEKVQNRPTIVIDCHTDEVGFIVEHIKSNGTATFLPLGGWYIGNIPAMAVTLKNEENEKIEGIITSKPPHFMTDEEKNRLPKLSELAIDIGSSSSNDTKEIFKIDTGTPVAPDVKFSYNKITKLMKGKAFDNRVGCAATITVLNELKNKNLDKNIVGVFASQEEVGLRGAQVAAYKIKPDFVIIFEGSPADDNFKDCQSAHGALKSGVQLRVIDASMISNPHLIKYVKELAKRKGIKYQVIAREKGSTNGGKYHISETGIPTLVLGIPTRYVHTPYCYASIEDLQSAIELALAVINEIKLD